MGESGPYLGEAARCRVCSHGGSDTLLSGSALAHLSQRFKGAQFNWKSAFRVQAVLQDVDAICSGLPALTALNLTNNLTSNNLGYGHVCAVILMKYGVYIMHIEVLKDSLCAIEELHLMGNKMRDITVESHLKHISVHTTLVGQPWVSIALGVVRRVGYLHSLAQSSLESYYETWWFKIYVQTLPGSLAICRVHGNPQFFVTFTCNVKWPEIKRRADKFLGLKARDRADAVAHFFEMNVKEMVKFLKERKPLGDIVAGGTNPKEEPRLEEEPPTRKLRGSKPSERPQEGKKGLLSARKATSLREKQRGVKPEGESKKGGS
nr:putative DNA helicase Pif1-like protein [Tanacetum cinerariifolium]GEY65331.1 putative DNA helicase Pif1-like protein [Tanacetum cinerariifolium]